MRPSILLYDWDNTLVDGWAGIAAALNAVFAAFAMPHWTAADTRARVRVSLRDSFPVMFGAEWERARDIFYAALEAQPPAPRRADAGRGRGAGGGGGVAAGRGLQQGGTLPARRGRASRLGGAFRRGGRRRRRRRPTSRTRRRSCWRSTGWAWRRTRSVWYLGDTALDMEAARAAGVTAVLVGDASHDGGIDRARPDLHFPSALGAGRPASCACAQGLATITAGGVPRPPGLNKNNSRQEEG